MVITIAAVALAMKQVYELAASAKGIYNTLAKSIDENISDDELEMKSLDDVIAGMKAVGKIPEDLDI